MYRLIVNDQHLGFTPWYLNYHPGRPIAENKQYFVRCRETLRDGCYCSCKTAYASEGY